MLLLQQQTGLFILTKSEKIIKAVQKKEWCKSGNSCIKFQTVPNKQQVFFFYRWSYL